MNNLTAAMCAVLFAAVAALPVRADELRRVRLGQAIPEFSLPTLDGKRVGHAELKDRSVIIVFLSAQQRRSEMAAADAQAVWRKLHRDDLELVFATADTDQAPYFRMQRDASRISRPLLLDADRRLYGDLGLVVLPTTIVIDPKWRLAHVISSYKSDYKHVLRAFAEHALGSLDAEGLRQRLETSTFDRDRPEHRIARHRAAARVLQSSGLTADAEKELRAALKIDAKHIDVQLDLAALLITRDRVKEAKALVTRVLAADAGHRRGRLIHGAVLYHGGELDQAEKVLTEALLFNTDPVQTHNYLGLTYERKGDTVKALEHYRQCLTRVLEDHPL